MIDKEQREKLHREMMQRKAHPYADIKAEKKEDDIDEEMSTVVKISSRNQPDLDLMEYYNDWRASDAGEAYPKSHSVRSTQSPTTSSPASEITRPCRSAARTITPPTIRQELPPPIRERRDSLTKSERVQKELEEAMNELKAARANPPTPPPVFEEELDFSSIPLPEPLVLDLSVDSGHVDSVADELVDERALATDVDLWSNQSSSPQHSPRALKSILKRNPPTLESAAIEKFEIEVPAISFTDQSQTGTLQVDRVKSPKNLPEAVISEEEVDMPLKSAQESSDEVDRQLQLLMSNLKTPAFVADRVCQKCCGMISPDAGCSPMGIDLHISCFKCSTCSKPLYQTEYRATLQNEFFCDPCYNKQKAICCVCDSDIEGRVITFAEKSFHPNCFNCYKCCKNLQFEDCTTFEDKVCCIKCFYRASAKICARCSKSIVPEDGAQEAKQITIAGVSFHKSCFSCKDCKIMLFDPNSGGPFDFDGEFVCQKCAQRRRKNAVITKRLHRKSSSTAR